MRVPILRIVAAVLFAATPVHAQIATDGSMGARTSFAGNNIRIPSTIGTGMGRNLFHSFSTFNVANGQNVSFDANAPGAFGLSNYLNIIGRVTGGTASSILGTIRSTEPGTSLYLVNPSGIVFGPGAVVDVNGSFHASSAHYIGFGDGTRFETRLGPDVRLSSAPPSAFGFGEGFVAPLAVQGGQLRVRDGAAVGLVGGGILVGGVQQVSRLQAFGGNAIVVAVASPGEVGVGPDGVTLSGFTRMADVLLQRSATISVSEGPERTGAGTIYIRGHNVGLDQGLVFANTRFSDGGGIDIAASGDITLRRADVTAVTTGAGNAGTIRLSGRNIVVLEGTLVDTSCDPGCTTGNGGLIDVRATDHFIIRSIGAGVLAGAYVASNSFGGGRTGEIRVDAGTVVIEGNALLQGTTYETGDGTLIQLRANNIQLLNGGQVDVSTLGSGRGGAIVVENAGNIRVEGTRTDAGRPLPLPSGFFANTRGSGNAGSVTVSTRTLEVVRGGEISSTAVADSTGTGGRIAVNASESILVAGTDAQGYKSGIATNTLSRGNAGEIFLSAPSIVITDDGKVQSQSEGDGRAGRIRIEGGDLTISSLGQVSSDARRGGDAGAVEVALTGTLSISGVAGTEVDNEGRVVTNTGIFAKTYETGLGGNISIDASRIVLAHAGGIIASTDGSRDAGNVDVRARESILMNSFGRISTSTNEKSTGGAGSVSVYARDGISMSQFAAISSDSESPGAAGMVDVRTDGILAMADFARISTSSLLAGNAGDVRVRAGGGITVSRNALIASESFGAGLAGDVDVVTDGVLEVREGARISTAALSSDGGNIRVTANGAFLDSGRITTEVGTGQGGGGNIELQSPTLVLHSANISANAFGGPGGNIHIASQTFIPSADSSVTASSALGVDGTVTLESPAIDPTGALLIPAVAFFDAGSVLAGRCGPRLAGRASSLLVEPRRMADVAPDALRSMLEILVPENSSTCPPAAPQRF